MPEVSLQGLVKKFAQGNHLALKDVSLDVEAGEFVALVGPSGCGKSTTLRILAGLEEADAGDILLGGVRVNDVPPDQRDIAMVFQGYALYPTMTVRENMGFPLRMRKVKAAEAKERIEKAATLLKIGKLLDRRPHQLSGGERQRVAMGRAIVRNPRVFLFDEPLSNLDAALRTELRVEIAELVRKLGRTAIYVTHDQAEAMTMADRIAVMNQGIVQSYATPRDTYERPATAFVAGFLGNPRMNLLDASVQGRMVRASPFAFEWNGADTVKKVGLRPEELGLADRGIEAKVIGLEPLGAETHVRVEANGQILVLRVRGFAKHRIGDKVHLSPAPAHFHAFDENGDRVEERA